MNTLTLAHSGLAIPQLALGCMRITNLSKEEARTLIETALELGVNFFDHANIYGNGMCESHFAQSLQMNSKIREKILLQTKCSIRYGISYDCSYQHIVQSVEESLARLQTEYLDSLLLHQPDALIEPEEVAKAFDALKAAGKVRHFGVSNFNTYQMKLLKKFCNVPLEFNQLQLSLATSYLIDAGLNVNSFREGALNRDGMTLDYCRLNDITIQAWSPYHKQGTDKVIIDNPDFERMNKCLKEVSEKYGISKQALLIAWINRHPAKIQTLLGTTNLERLKDTCTAATITLSREDWYKLYVSTGKFIAAVSNRTVEGELIPVQG